MYFKCPLQSDKNECLKALSALLWILLPFGGFFKNATLAEEASHFGVTDRLFLGFRPCKEKRSDGLLGFTWKRHFPLKQHCCPASQMNEHGPIGSLYPAYPGPSLWAMVKGRESPWAPIVQGTPRHIVFQLRVKPFAGEHTTLLAHFLALLDWDPVPE